MTYDQWKTTDPREFEREEEAQPTELELAYDWIRKLEARIRMLEAGGNVERKYETGNQCYPREEDDENNEEGA